MTPTTPEFPAPAGFPAPAIPLAAVPTCEAFNVRIGAIWLMVLLVVGGLVTGLVNAVTTPSVPVLVLAVVATALGIGAGMRGYTAVRLELRPGLLRIQPAAVGRPAQDVPLTQIANYLSPTETYYQVLELQLHGGSRLRFSKRLRTPGAGLLPLNDWVEVLAQRLEAAHSAIAAASLAGSPASGLAATRPRVLARTVVGKVLAGVAGVWLLLAGIVLLDHTQAGPAAWVFIAPSLYLSYYFRARGALKIQTHVFTGTAANNRDDDDKDDWQNNNSWQNNE